MSASLVGSEMCIRDRSLSFRDAPSIVQHCVLHATGEGCQGRMALREAVSYTHLTLPTICSV
eukprot:6191192-Alexandrium_andersonii.AAC.1